MHGIPISFEIANFSHTVVQYCSMAPVTPLTVDDLIHQNPQFFKATDDNGQQYLCTWKLNQREMRIIFNDGTADYAKIGKPFVGGMPFSFLNP